MGIDYRTYIVVGIEVEYREVEERKTITKYNENTGEPYQKEITDYSGDWYITGTNIRLPAGPVTPFKPLINDLYLFPEGASGSRGILGRSVEDTNPHYGEIINLSKVLPFNNVLHISSKIKEALDYNCSPMVYLVNFAW